MTEHRVNRLTALALFPWRQCLLVFSFGIASRITTRIQGICVISNVG